MSQSFQHRLYQIAIDGLHLSKLHRLFARSHAGLGAILTFHRVAREPDGFAPNAGLSVTPEFFEGLVAYLEREGVRVIGMSELRRRLVAGDGGQGRVVTLSFDDGYRDNFDHAFQICRRHGVPMTVNLTTGFMDRATFAWWYAIEEVARRRDRVLMPGADGGIVEMAAATPAAKRRAFARLFALFDTADAVSGVARLDRLGELNGIDLRAYCGGLMMSWEMVAEMAASGLVEFGAHTLSHPALRRLTEGEAEREMAASRAALAARLGRPVEHFAYPFGGPAEAGGREFALAERLGFETAVTTRHGTLHLEHKHHLHALPRMSVNGHHQNLRTIEVFLSGASTALQGAIPRKSA